MKVSILTPTADREKFLQGLYLLLQAQTYSDWEWLIYDTSLHSQTFSDPRVCYTHSNEILSIGEKRNRLIQKAQGDVLVHCDDDDYYAPSYLEFIVENLKKCAFFTFHSWFSYDLKSMQVFYRMANELCSSHYVVNALSGPRIREIEIGGKRQEGYGFSFAYRREVVQSCSFPDCDLGEDQQFYKQVKKSGFSIIMEADRVGRLIHVIHDLNTSSDYPQYRVPLFLVENLFPEFFTYIADYENN